MAKNPALNPPVPAAPTAKRPRGRPPSPGGPKPQAEIQRAYRARLAAQAADTAATRTWKPSWRCATNCIMRYWNWSFGSRT
jgi:hypothetical protein